MSNWSDLLEEIFILIAKRITNVSNNIRFSGVCKSWRAIGLKDRQHLLGCQLPGFIIPEHSHEPCKTHLFLPFTKVDLYDNIKHLVHHNMPLLSLPHDSHCFGSYQGWLLIWVNKRLLVLNPISGTEFSLPVMSSGFPIKKVVFSSSPSTSASNYYIFIIHWPGFLKYCKLGDKAWSKIEYADPMIKKSGHIDAICYKGYLYVLRERFRGRVFVCDFTANSPKFTELLVAMPRQPLRDSCYLVEAGSELVLVYRTKCCSNVLDSYKTTKFEIYILDFSEEQWLKVTSLGEYAFFLGHSQSFSLSKQDVAGIKGNHIYFLDDYIPRKPLSTFDDSDKPKEDLCYDMGLFNVETSNIEFYPPNFRLAKSCSIWFTPIP